VPGFAIVAVSLICPPPSNRHAYRFARYLLKGGAGGRGRRRDCCRSRGNTSPPYTCAPFLPVALHFCNLVLTEGAAASTAEEVAERRQVIKNKILAVGKMSRVFAVLRYVPPQPPTPVRAIGF
jgi:hypothetical protein